MQYTVKNEKSARSRLRWNLIAEGMYHLAAQKWQQHNRSLIEKGVRRNDPRIVKTGEIETLNTLISQYCRQVAARVNMGTAVATNVVATNRAAARKGRHAPSGTPRHLHKLAKVGLLVATPTPEDDDARTKLDEEFGVRPAKAWHGTKADFELLVSPDIVPQAHFERIGIQFFPLDGFATAAEESPLPADTATSKELIETTKRQKLAHRITKNNTIVIKELVKEAAASPRVVDSEDGNKPKAETKEGEGAGRGAAAGDERSQVPTNRIERPSWRLWKDGHHVRAGAEMLIRAYHDELIPAMGRKPYHPGEMDRGRDAAEKLLERVKPDQLGEKLDRYLHTIKHMAQWLRLNPKGFVMPPSKWFDPLYKTGILNAERKFLRRYEARKDEFADLAKMRAAQAKEKYISNADWAQAHANSIYAQTAFRLWVRLCELHPTDTRLRGAKLGAWMRTIRSITKRDRYKLQLVHEVMKWLIEGQGTQARWWREEAAEGIGIRSARGVRKNFQKMVEAMRSDIAYELREAQRAKRKKTLPNPKSLKNDSPKQVPGTYRAPGYTPG